MLRGFFTLIIALLFPSSGIGRGLNAIYQRAIFCETPLETACKAGALCVVIRTKDWKPRSGESVRGVRLDQETQQPKEDAMEVEMQKNVGVVSRFFASEFPEPETAPLALGQDDTHAADEEANTDRISKQRVQAVDVISGPLSTNNVVGELDEIDTIPKIRIQDPWPDPELGQGVGESRSFMPATRFWQMSGRTVHGVCELPEGYALSILPSNTSASRLMQNTTIQATQRGKDTYRVDGICMSYNFSKAVIAVFQTIYASFTLYETRGDQIARYGYAAFGLTVTSYLLMSVVNLVSNTVTPDFPTVYLMRDQVMTEAEHRIGKKFERVVGTVQATPHVGGVNVLFKGCSGVEVARGHTLDHQMVLKRLRDESFTMSENVNFDEAQPPDEDDRFGPLKVENVGRLSPRPAASAASPRSTAPTVLVPFSDTFEPDLGRRFPLAMFFNVYFPAIPIAVIGGLTHFRPGQSSRAQRTWILMWFVFGIGVSPILNQVLPMIGDNIGLFLFVIAFYSAPAIGGLVVVAQMLSVYGSCTELF
jgi:hypothetical protein